MLKIRSYTIDKLFELLKDSCSKESIYWTERKSYLNNECNEFVKSTERDEMVAYLLEVCDRDDMSLSTETFALFVALLDRFLSTYKVKSKYLECLAVACLYIACKVREEDEKISITSEFLMDCDCKCSVAELLRMEQMVLSKFEWSVNDVTSVDFMHIYYGLLLNQYKQIEFALETSNNHSMNNSSKNNNNKRVWKPLTHKLVNLNSNSDGSFYPPGDLDFLDSLETKLKQCLCVNDLTNMFSPHTLAFSLISLQMDKSFESIQSDMIKNSLSDMLDSIKQYCKLSFEQVDKCKEQLKTHLASVENTKTLFDNYFDEYYHLKIRNLKQSSIFASPLSAVSSVLDVIKEEDEPEEEEEPEEVEDDYKLENENENVEIDEDSYDISDYLTKKDDKPIVTNNNPSLLFNNNNNNDNNSKNFFTQIENQYEPIYYNNSKMMSISYADILTGRKDNKRKLSENSNTDEEMD